MKKNKVIYWLTTSIVSLMMLFAGFNYLFNDKMKTAFTHLGFPGSFRIELAIAKILGVIALLIPLIPNKIKEFAYHGFFITFISAFIAHESNGDPISIASFPIICVIMLSVSYFYFELLIQIK